MDAPHWSLTARFCEHIPVCWSKEQLLNAPGVTCHHCGLQWGEIEAYRTPGKRLIDILNGVVDVLDEETLSSLSSLHDSSQCDPGCEKCQAQHIVYASLKALANQARVVNDVR